LVLLTFCWCFGVRLLEKKSLSLDEGKKQSSNTSTIRRKKNRKSSSPILTSSSC
jgi:hypothetical protein